jgi:hypothetical protein
MDQTVINNTNEDLSVMWDGMQNYFRSGQQRVFPSGIADSLVIESKGSLKFKTDEVETPKVEAKVEIKTEPAIEVPVVSKDVYTMITTKTGGKQYRMNGKIISKVAYDAGIKSQLV